MSEPVHRLPGAGVAAHSSLRDRLRAETRAAHVALDARVSGFDLATRAGFTGFLTMQVQALSGLMRVSDGAAAAPIIAELAARARADLNLLAAHLPGHAPALAPRPASLALDYVITGSRLGSRVLKRRWAATDDPAVRAAGAYFGAPDHIDAWKAFCATAERHPACGAEADRIVADATALFYFYDECAGSAVTREREPDV